MTGQRRSRGFALLLVLWTLVLISLIVTHLASTGREEARIALNLANGAHAEAAADGALYETVFRLLDASDRHWAVDGTTRRLRLAGGEAAIRIMPEAGKVNPNVATPELLQALFLAVGVDKNLAPRLASAICDWREPGDMPRPDGAKLPQYQAAGMDHGPPGEPFQSLDELGRVLGMTPQILDAVRPHMSLYQQGPPDPSWADPVVLAALKLLQPQNNNNDDDSDEAPGPLNTVTITVEADMESGARFTRRAVVRLGPSFPRGFMVLEWDAA